MSDATQRIMPLRESISAALADIVGRQNSGEVEVTLSLLFWRVRVAALSLLDEFQGKTLLPGS
jgi:hypothetical protein